MTATKITKLMRCFEVYDGKSYFSAVKQAITELERDLERRGVLPENIKSITVKFCQKPWRIDPAGYVKAELKEPN